MTQPPMYVQPTNPLMMTNSGVPLPAQYIMSNPYVQQQQMPMMYTMVPNPQGGPPIYMATNPAMFYAPAAIPNPTASNPSTQQ